MKPSHLTTPRQLSDCTFTVGCPEARTQGDRLPWSALVAFAAGLLVGVALFAGR